MKWNFLSSVSPYNPFKSASIQHCCFKVVPKNEVSCSFQKIKLCVESDAKITQDSGEQRSGFALKNFEAGYCSAVNYPLRTMAYANDDRNNEFELSCCPVEEASHDDHHNDEEESSGNRDHRNAGWYNCPEKYQDDGEEEVNKDESLRGGFDVKEALRNGEDCEDEEERNDNWESSWTSLLAVGGNCSEQRDEICKDDKKYSERTGLHGGEAYCLILAEERMRKMKNMAKMLPNRGMKRALYAEAVMALKLTLNNETIRWKVGTWKSEL